MFGWIPLTASKPGAQPWGGHLALPREVHALPDGTLGARLHPAVGPRLRGGALLPPLAKALALDAKASRQGFVLPENEGGLDIEVLVEPAAGCTQTGVALDAGPAESRIAVAVNLAHQRLVIRGTDAEVWSDLPIAVAAGQLLLLRIIVEGDIVEAFLMDRYSLAARVPHRIGGRRLDLFVDAGAARVHEMKVFRLAQQGDTEEPQRKRDERR
jgi:hypothetical protein